MIVNKEPYPISFELQASQALVCRYGEELRQYKMKPDIDVSGLSCLLQIAKPDGTFTENGVDVITDEEDECYLILTIPKQATVVKGVAKYSICCYGEVDTEMHLIYSAEGPLWVDDDLITEEMIQSVAEVNGYTFPQDFFTVDMIPDIIPLVTAEILDDDTTSDSTTWSSTKIYEEITQAAGATDLGDLSDVSIIDPQEEDIIIYDNVAEMWKNAKIPGHVYSTQEHIAGKWIDGSEIYEKTIVVDSGFSSTMTVAHGIANIDKIIGVEGIVETFHPAWLPLTDNVPVAGYNVTVEGYSRTDFSVYIGISRVSDVAAIYVTLRYTKTA